MVEPTDDYEAWPAQTRNAKRTPSYDKHSETTTSQIATEVQLIAWQIKRTSGEQDLVHGAISAANRLSYALWSLTTPKRLAPFPISAIPTMCTIQHCRQLLRRSQSNCPCNSTRLSWPYTILFILPEYLTQLDETTTTSSANRRYQALSRSLTLMPLGADPLLSD